MIDKNGKLRRTSNRKKKDETPQTGIMTYLEQDKNENVFYTSED